MLALSAQTEALMWLQTQCLVIMWLSAGDGAHRTSEPHCSRIKHFVSGRDKERKWTPHGGSIQPGGKRT